MDRRYSILFMTGPHTKSKIDRMTETESGKKKIFKLVVTHGVI